MNRDSKKTALTRVKILFKLAAEVARDRPDLAQRYAEIARKISMRTRTHLPRKYHLQVCKRCKRFILPGVTSRVRIQPRREPHVVVTCLYCGGRMRVPLKRKVSK
ncbi:ribonuclease P [Candidatus Bathyarchaeota archaeon]|nr:MAG: ribonuclease P [Candidatus Bathyarchaeota archaeon]